MKQIFASALAWMRDYWREILAVHLVYIALGIMLFAPLLGLLGQVLLKLSGKPALADMDLLFFVLSPPGMIAAILFLAITIVISAFELASLMAIGVLDVNGKHVNLVSILGFSLGKVKPLFEFAARLVAKILLIAVPFLLVAGLTAYLLITEHDINYYLAVQPLEYWVAVIIIGLTLFSLALLILWRLANWSMALPLVLFAGVKPVDSFASSTKIFQQSRNLVLQGLIAWVVVISILGAVEIALVKTLATLLVPLFIHSVALLALLFGSLTVLLMAAGTIVAAFAVASLAFLLVILAYRAETGLHGFDLPSGRQSVLVTTGLNKRWYRVAFACAVCVSVLLGYTMLDEIQFTDEVKIIAHRGSSASAPENTMASIRQAIEDGADWIEIDVQESADGEIIVIHDSDLMKLAGVNIKAWEVTSKDLDEIDVGGWFAPEFSGERIPTLEAVLAEVKGKSRLVVELKYYGHDEQLEQRVIELVESAQMQDEVMIMSLEYAGIQKVRALRPGWKIGLLSARAVGDLTRLDADFLAVNMALARPSMVQAVHAAGKEMYVWTVNDALAMSQVMSLGVDGVITDEPKKGREVLSARAGLSSVQRLLLHMAPLFGVEAPSLSLQYDDAPASDENINFELSLHQRLQDRISLPGTVLEEFSTDGCSGGLSVGWDHFAEQAGFFRQRHGIKPPWERCCIEHDRAYHLGGGSGLTAMESFLAREQADNALRACVLDTRDGRMDSLKEAYGFDESQVTEVYQVIAESMHTAVRLGGMPCSGLSWRWGYGWPGCEESVIEPRDSGDDRSQ